MLFPPLFNAPFRSRIQTRFVVCMCVGRYSVKRTYKRTSAAINAQNVGVRVFKKQKRGNHERQHQRPLTKRFICCFMSHSLSIQPFFIFLYSMSHTHIQTLVVPQEKPSSLFSLSVSVCAYSPRCLFFFLSLFPRLLYCITVFHSLTQSYIHLRIPYHSPPPLSAASLPKARSLSRSPNARGTALARSRSLSQNPARTEFLKIQQEQNCSKSSKNRIRVRGGDGDADEAVDECWLIHSQQQFMLLAETRDSV